MFFGKSKIFKLLILSLLFAFVFTKSSILLHGFSHGNVVSIQMAEHDNDKGKEDCYLCDFIGVYAKILFFASLSLGVFLLYYFRILARLDILKLSYFLSSKFSRGPPIAT